MIEIDIKFKDLLWCMNTDQSVKVKINGGKEYCPNYMELDCYKEFYVSAISSDSNTLVISLVEGVFMC